MNLELRDFAIRDIGCIAARMFAGIKVPCEKHHLNAFDKPGGKRRGERFTIGLSQWAHTGRCLCQELGPKRRCDHCKKTYGPSWVYHTREFIETFGDGDTMLAYQDQLIDQWRRGQLC